MALSTSGSEIECKCWKPAGNGHNTLPPMSAVTASDILCPRHFQMANLQMLLISKINRISLLLWELGLGGLWNCRVQLAYHPLVKLRHKQVLAHQFTSRMTSSTCKTHILSWLPASRSELNYLLLLMREQGSSSLCCLCKYALIDSGKELTSLEIIAISIIWVEGACLLSPLLLEGQSCRQIQLCPLSVLLMRE